MKTERIWRKLSQWISKYPIVFSVLGIYAYYLFTTLNFFKRSESTHLSLFDFILQYDSLFWMWLVVYVVSRAQSMKLKYESDESDRPAPRQIAGGCEKVFRQAPRFHVKPLIQVLPPVLDSRRLKT